MLASLFSPDLAAGIAARLLLADIPLFPPVASEQAGRSTCSTSSSPRSRSS